MATALLLLDSGAMGPVLACHFIKKHKIQLERKLHKVQMLAATAVKLKEGPITLHRLGYGLETMSAI